MSGTVQAYAWGSSTVLPRFLGREPDGRPQAELWLGAHPAAPSRIGGKALDAVIEADPERVVGPASVARFGARLPYLLKVLAAAQPLSLQAHPTRGQAEAGFARESAAGLAIGSTERVFADDWPKPEMMVALTPVDALCGFREPTQTYAQFERLGVAQAIRLVEPLRSGDPAALRDVLARMLRLTETSVVAELVATAERDDSEFARTAVELNRFFPDDRGVLAALLLNRIRLEPGQALFLPAGHLHAYLDGSGVEIMANSDNTLRGGLTGKRVAVDELLDILEFTAGVPPLTEPVTERAGVQHYPTPAPEFRLWRLEPPGGEPVELPAGGSGRIVLGIDGELTLSDGETERSLRRGEAAFCLPTEVIRLHGSGVAFVAGPGLD